MNGERDFAARLRETASVERMQAEVVNAHVIRKVFSTLAHATRSVPWYRERIGTLERPRDVWELLTAFPELTKAELQLHEAELRSASYHGRIVHKTTGGSTGQPVRVAKDPSAVSFERAATWSFYQSYGIGIGDRCIRFWGSPTTPRRALRARLADLASNRVTLSAFGLGERELESHWKRCLNFQAPFFYGYASMLAAFAEYIEGRGLDGTRTGVKVIVSTSEVLTKAHRDLLSRVFQATIRDEYGCGEFGPIAYECESGLLHVAYNNVLAEVITTDGRTALPGESGRLVITDLNNQAMPLIRFSIGDNAEVGGRCACGRNSPTLRRIWGREYDFIELPDGRRYHGEFLMYLFEDLATRGLRVNQFQVIQERDLSVTLRIVGAGAGAEIVAQAAATEARKRLAGLSVTCLVVEEIERRSSGKTPLIIRRA